MRRMILIAAACLMVTQTGCLLGGNNKCTMMACKGEQAKCKGCNTTMNCRDMMAKCSECGRMMKCGDVTVKCPKCGMTAKCSESNGRCSMCDKPMKAEMMCTGCGKMTTMNCTCMCEACAKSKA